MIHKATLVTRTVPGIDEVLQSRPVVGLNRNLASLTDLSAAYKQAHWTLTGIAFAQLHALFDQSWTARSACSRCSTAATAALTAGS